MQYDVYTNMDSPDHVTNIGLAIYAKWLGFALGQETLNGKRLKHPTGRYASAIFFEQKSPTHVAILVDEGIAPEAAILETGHRAIDLKRSGLAGRTIPLHRGQVGAYGSLGYGPAVVSSAPTARGRNIWAAPKAQGFTGFRRVPSKITAKNRASWVIPAMSAYAPSQALADLFRNELS